MKQIWVRHNSHLKVYRSPFGAVSCNQTITLRLDIDKAVRPSAVYLRTWRENTGETRLAMSPFKTAPDDITYQAVVHAAELPGNVWYYFIVEIGSKLFYYGNNAESLGGEGQLYEHEPPSYQITVYKEGAVTPNWFKEAVIYQIMPDRFYNGEPDSKVLNSKKGSVIHACWDNTPFYIRDPDTGRIVSYDFFGGNLRGIIVKLPYLKELGITVIYLNPIFASPSNHRYDTADYYNVDSMLGDNELFAELCRRAAEYNISVILDGVFSHTGSDSIYFNREGSYSGIGAFQSQQSPYYQWYRFKNWPDDYESWWGIDTLPNVNESEPSYMDFIINNEHSVLKHWLRLGAKGWRLDVVDELPAEFVRAFRKELKAADPDAVLIGEVWEDASRKISYGEMRQYLCGEELDSAMNYPFRQIVLEFILGYKDASQTSASLMSLYENYPKHNFYTMMNLIGSHDVPRIMTLLGQAPPAESLKVGEQAKYRLSPEKRWIATARLKLLVLWQMTFPGVPSVYYGDEAGLEGYKDPFNRGTFPWGSEGRELLAWHQKMILFRHRNAALKTGEYLPVVADGDVFAYIRRIQNGRDVFGQVKEDGVIFVCFNRSILETKEISINIRPWCRGILIDALSGHEIPLEKGMLKMSLAPLDGKMLIQKEENPFSRQCGILLHPSSLPSRYGIGDLGKEAYEFVNFLVRSKQKLWQVLPLHPTGFGESPYQCLSAFAGNPLFISLGKLVTAKLLSATDIQGYPDCNRERVEYDKVRKAKDCLLRTAFEQFRREEPPAGYQEFVKGQAHWLEDYCMFRALKGYFKNAPWYEWPKEIARRSDDEMAYYRRLLSDELEYQNFLQYTFFTQWHELKVYANRWGIRLIGDMPLFIAADSSDVWATPQLFELDADGRPAKQAGVPPDYFSETGQLWGNPIYKWDEMAKDDYLWWRHRFELLLQTVDIIRIDHFRGFEAYWEVPAGEKTAENGRWVKGPGAAFFATMRKYLGNLPIIAEDLGVITPEVEDLKHEFFFPGMKVLHFVFQQDDGGDCAPVVIEKNSVVYTGTHDNDTTAGWYSELLETEPETAACVHRTLGVTENISPAALCRSLVEYAYAGNANTVILPMQDVLGLDSTARMNKPATVENNWQWRVQKSSFSPEILKWLAELAERHNR